MPRLNPVRLMAVLVAGAVCALGLPARAMAGAPGHVALRLQLIDQTGIREATCALIAREQQGSTVVLSFVTAAHLFKDMQGETRFPVTTRVDIDGTSLEVRAEDITVPRGNAIDVAVLRVTVASSALAAPRVTRDLPEAGEAFHIEGFARDQTPTQIGLHVSGRTSLALVGSRELSGLASCEGAPAVSESGVFGIVTECRTGEPPTIVPFAAAAGWIARSAKGFVLASGHDSLRLIEKDVDVPLAAASCGEAEDGSIEVPLALAAGERAVDASVSIWRRHSLRLADVTVGSVSDRSIKLRFTLSGDAPAAFPTPIPCPQGQALVTVRVSVITSPR